MRSIPRAVALLSLGVLAAACAGEDSRESPNPRTNAEGILHAVLPSTALVGAPVRLAVSPLTDIGTPDRERRATLTVTSTDRAFEDRRGQNASGSVVFGTPGIHRLELTDSEGRVAVAGPVRVVRSEEELRARPGEAALRIFWGDAHGHSDVGDGTHPPENYLFYAREVAHLDFTCLSEHDYQQFLGVGLDELQGSWDRTAELAREWRRPGFAVLLGWEWSSRRHGHRVVLFRDDASRYVSYQDFSSPAELAENLRGVDAISIVAHPTGSHLTPAIEWETLVPGFDRAIEIYSGHGTMDGDPDFRPPSEPRPERTAIDALRRGHRLAFVGFSDTHLTTPGNPSPPPIRDAPYRGGLTAVLAPTASEADVYDALKEGRCYATSGERFLVELRVNDRLLGEAIEIRRGERVRVSGFVSAPVELTRVELMGDDEVLKALKTDGREDARFSFTSDPLDRDVAIWLRGESKSGERFWTTPVWVSSPDPGAR